ncbi:MAG: 6-pyruvoyltetrahydropterin/6-carboxytetrahydropterin synthase [Abditibacteriota bacterium]|nr:6-pyruvoyltetrahydropterin/6-carboxytetrahydropterin synthase [Abditibacteriota bacterium]
MQNPDWDEARNRQVFGKRAGAHGHDYVLDVFYRGVVSDDDGMIVNLDELKPVLKGVLAKLDGEFLNDMPYFEEHRPTLENLVNFIWHQLPSSLGQGRLARVQLQETARRKAEKTEQFMRVTTCYEFAAAHRLHAPQISDEENSELYGKCNNPRGHGHNYGLEVSVEGVPDAQTGAVIGLEELDRIVDEEVFTRFDHKHLNDDCPEFRDMIPTSENLARVIFDVLSERLQRDGHKLAKIGLHETQKNYFEVEA